MKLSPSMIAAATAILCGLTSLCYISPVVRARVQEHSQRWFGWTDESRAADPVGFATYVDQRLQSDLEQLRTTKLEMGTAVGELNKKMREQEELAGSAMSLAEEFRSAFQNASSAGDFPLTVRNASYTEPQVAEQVSLLLAEAGGYNKSLSMMRGVQRQASEKLEALTVRIDSTEAQLAVLGTQRELLRSRKLTTDGERLVAELNSLFGANSQAIAGNPIRTVRELLAANNKPSADQPNLDSARAFLTAKIDRPFLVPATDKVEPKLDSESTTEATESYRSDEYDVRDLPRADAQERPAARKPSRKAKAKPSGKPIFSQF